MRNDEEIASTQLEVEPSGGLRNMINTFLYPDLILLNSTITVWVVSILLTGRSVIAGSVLKIENELSYIL